MRLLRKSLGRGAIVSGRGPGALWLMVVGMSLAVAAGPRAAAATYPHGSVQTNLGGGLSTRADAGDDVAVFDALDITQGGVLVSSSFAYAAANAGGKLLRIAAGTPIGNVAGFMESSVSNTYASAAWNDVMYWAGSEGTRPDYIKVRLGIEATLELSLYGSDDQSWVRGTADIHMGGGEYLIIQNKQYGKIDTYTEISGWTAYSVVGKQFMGLIEYEARYDPYLGGYRFGADASASTSGMNGASTLADARNTVWIDGLFDPQGRAIESSVRFDSGITLAAVPEPSTCLMFGIAIGTVALRRARGRIR